MTNTNLFYFKKDCVCNEYSSYSESETAGNSMGNLEELGMCFDRNLNKLYPRGTTYLCYSFKAR